MASLCSQSLQRECESLCEKILFLKDIVGYTKEIEKICKEIPQIKGLMSDTHIGKFYQIFKNEMVPVLHELFQSVEKTKGNFLIF